MQGIFGGPIIIENVGGSAVVQFGGSIFLSPKHLSKTYTGAGGGHNAAFNISYSGPSATNSVVTSVIDQPISATT